MTHTITVDVTNVNRALLVDQLNALGDLAVNGDLLHISEEDLPALGRLLDFLKPVEEAFAGHDPAFHAELEADFEQLRADKLIVLEILDAGFLSVYQADMLNGVIQLLDYIQDNCADRLGFGSLAVFGNLE